MKKFILSIPILILLLYSCTKDDNEIIDQQDYNIEIPSSNGNPGIGDSYEEPLGTPLFLPSGIRIVERRDHPFDSDIRKLYAYANFFYVDINLVNDRMPGTPPVIVEFPAGIISVSTIHDKQNGLTIEKSLIAVPPTEKLGGGRDTTTVYIGMACLNENRSMPWYDNIGHEMTFPISRNNYQKFIITSDPGLLKLLNILKGHSRIKVTNHWDPVESHREDYVVPEWMKIHNEIQDHIWDVTDRHGLTHGKIEKLQERLKPYR